MLSQKMTDKINEQIGKEYFSAYMYRGIAAYFDEKSMNGFGHWFKKQAVEEYEHAEKFVKYLEDHNARVVLPALDKPKMDYAGVAEALKAAYDHEKYISASIREISLLAKEEDDFLTLHFLGWFHEEQLEEENSALALLEEYEYIGDNKAAQRSMDRGLAQRV